MFVNILGFIPFGFAVYAWLRKDGEWKIATVTVIVLLLGASISIFIELLSMYLTSRDSSLTGVMNNVLGTYIGVRLFRIAHEILYRLPVRESAFRYHRTTLNRWMTRYFEMVLSIWSLFFMTDL